MHSNIEIFLSDIEDERLKGLFQYATDLIFNLIPGIESGIKWNVPFFSYKGKNFCYLNKGPHNNLIIGFPMGKLLTPRTLLVNTEAKEVRHIHINSLKDFNDKQLTEVLIEAITII